MKTKPITGPELLTKEQLCERLNLPSVSSVEALMRSRKISFMRLGHRTVRFSWAKVQEELSRLEIKAVGS